jgi:predicted PhzF superfamily epimerase YddE/YHI9
MQKLWIVDAFTNVPFKGNPAGVVIVKEFPQNSYMQNIAFELGLSETAFVKPLREKQYHIRWFTPLSEAPLCGHATIGSTHVLMEEGLENQQAEITFESMGGILKASKTGNWYNLDFPAFPIKPIDYSDEIRRVADVAENFIGWSQNCIFLEMQSEQDLVKLVPNLDALKKIDCRALIVTAKSKNYDFVSRYFAPSVGIDEDPVCASAHCRLIPYWASKLGKDEMVAYQASKRSGIIKCKNLGNRVLISGEAVTVFKGDIIANQLRSLKNAA